MLGDRSRRRRADQSYGALRCRRASLSFKDMTSSPVGTTSGDGVAARWSRERGGARNRADGWAQQFLGQELGLIRLIKKNIVRLWCGLSLGVGLGAAG